MEGYYRQYLDEEKRRIPQKNLPLEKLVSEKSNKNQIKEFLESLGKWKNIQKGYTFYYKCLRDVKNEDGFLDKLAEYLKIDSDEFQKVIDETESIIEADKKQRRKDASEKELREQKEWQISQKKSFKPSVNWNYKRRTGVFGMGSAYLIKDLEDKTFPKLNESVQSILSKSENIVTDEVIKEIGKEIKKHYLENSDNSLIEIMKYNFFPTFESTSSFDSLSTQDTRGMIEYNCDGETIMKKENE